MSLAGIIRHAAVITGPIACLPHSIKVISSTNVCQSNTGRWQVWGQAVRGRSRRHWSITSPSLISPSSQSLGEFPSSGRLLRCPSSASASNKWPSGSFFFPASAGRPPMSLLPSMPSSHRGMSASQEWNGPLVIVRSIMDGMNNDTANNNNTNTN